MYSLHGLINAGMCQLFERSMALSVLIYTLS